MAESKHTILSLLRVIDTGDLDAIRLEANRFAVEVKDETDTSWNLLADLRARGREADAIFMQSKAYYGCRILGDQEALARRTDDVREVLRKGEG